MAEELWINGTKVHEVGASVAAPGGNGVIAAVEIDFGSPDREIFTEMRPLRDGLIFRGTVAKGRPFRLRFKVTGVAGRGEGFDEWEALLGLLAAENGLVSFKTVRPDAGASDVERELLAIATSEPAWKWVEVGSEDGIRQAGYFVASVDFLAPFPWWRSVDPETETINFSGTGSDDVNIARLGQMACGLEAKIATDGTLGQITLYDYQRTMSLTATFGATAKGVDWYFEDPTATSIDDGVVISIPSHLSLHSPTTKITASTADGGASGNHTVTIRYYPLWKSP